MADLPIGLALLAAIAVLLVLAVYRRQSPKWTGFVTRTDADGKTVPQKTLWDWLDLLLIPVVLVGAGALLNGEQDRREQEAAVDAQQERALQDYISAMSTLILDRGLLEAGSLDSDSDSSSVTVVAETRTLTTLRSLDGRRKAVVINFLDDSRLINSWGEDEIRVLDLGGADLSGIDLRDTLFCGLDISSADLRGADLRGAAIIQSYLTSADLTDARLDGADLFETDLSASTIDRTSFRGANLLKAQLNEVRGASPDFTSADLKQVSGDLSEVTDPVMADVTVSPDTALLAEHVKDANVLAFDPLDGGGCGETT